MLYFKLKDEFIKPINNYNIISVCVFRLKNSYKKTKIYSDGLKTLVNNFNQYFPNFYLRIYYDSSVLENYDDDMISDTNNIWIPLFDLIRKNPKIQLIKYDIPLFRINKTYHDGIIGTFARFIPLFDLKMNEQIKTIIIMDIDITPKILGEYKNMFELMNSKKLNFFYGTGLCYELKNIYSNLNKFVNTNDIIMGGMIMSKIKFPISIMNNFIKGVLNNEEFYNAYINNYFNIDTKIYSESIKNKFITTRMPYGLDEYMLMFVKEYIDKKSIKYGIIYKYLFVASLFFNINNLHLENKIDKNEYNKFLKNVLGKFYLNNKSIADNYKVLDNIIYTNTVNTKYLYVFNNLKTTCKNLIKSDKYTLLGIPSPNSFNCIINTPVITTNMFKIVN